MTENYVSTKDRIIATAIDIICDSGLSQLTTKTVSQKANISEPLLYKFYGDINELLVDVLEYYFQFDDRMRKTFGSKKESNVDRIKDYIEGYAIYYDNYVAISTIMLHYEEFLHNAATREIVMDGLMKRNVFLEGLIQAAIDQGEISDRFTAACILETIMGHIMICTMKRRLSYQKNSFRKEICQFLDDFLLLLSEVK